MKRLSIPVSIIAIVMLMLVLSPTLKAQTIASTATPTARVMDDQASCNPE
jgi:hypothetical protein